MSDKTKISWADSTASPWFGCSEVSPGCVNCYAREMTLRRGLAGWGDKAPRVLSKGFFKNVAAMNRKPWVCDECGSGLGVDQTANDCKCGQVGAIGKVHRRSVFPSLMDWLDPMPAGIVDQDGNKLDPNEVRARFLDTIRQTPNLQWLLLTKRPKLWLERLADMHFLRMNNDGGLGDWLLTWRDGRPPNVWIGTTVEDQPRADERIPHLLRIPAAKRFLSCEPLLGPIDLQWVKFPTIHNAPPHDENVLVEGISDIARERFPSLRDLHIPKIDWVIVGGESGKNYRPMKLEWLESIVAQCDAAKVPVFVKQDNGPRPGMKGRIPDALWAERKCCEHHRH